MNRLEDVKTEDLVYELKRRRWQGVDFVNVGIEEKYEIKFTKISSNVTDHPIFGPDIPYTGPTGTLLGTLSQTGPATILIITI